MGVWISEGERPGEGVLTVDPAIEGPILWVSVRSLLFRPGEYLTPDGRWMKTPHFFAAPRIADEDSPPRYRVGPDIVNHALAFDRIEIARKGDAKPLGAIDWPELAPGPVGAASPHSVYRPPARLREPEPDQPAPGKSETSKSEPRETGQGAPRLPESDRPEREAREPKPCGQDSARPEKDETPHRQDPLQPGPPRWGRRVAAALAVLALALAAVTAAPERCALFGLSCPPDPDPDEVARRAPSPAPSPVPRPSPSPAPRPIPDGVYNGHAEAACGEDNRTIRVDVLNGQIFWTHKANGVNRAWKGQITPQGDIRAQTVARDSARAAGRYRGSEHFIDMEYPECGRVRITIYAARPH